MLPLKPPVPKKNAKNIKLIDLPIFDRNGEVLDEKAWPNFQGVFNGKVILIKELEDRIQLSNFGSFGQTGSFDLDTFTNYKTLQNQVLRQKKDWQSVKVVSYEVPKSECKSVIKDSMNCQSLGESSISHENEWYIQKIKSLKRKSDVLEEEICIYPQEPTHVVVDENPVNWKVLKKQFSREYDQLLTLSGHEHCMPFFLLLEEAFFLCYTLECLEVREENGSIMGVLECWKKFNSLKKDFPFLYAAYHYYRSKGWAVKPGQQYGGDYVLYRSSQNYYHSSYVVLVNINGQNNELLSSWNNFFGCSRIIESANKELIICTVHGPVYDEEMPIDLSSYTVTDILVRRFVPSEHREIYGEDTKKD